jgi:hypothetical protein
VGPTNPVGLPTAAAEWGEPVLHPDVPLPNPVAALLASWRAPQIWTPVERADTLAHLEESGYRMRWVSRSGQHQREVG